MYAGSCPVVRVRTRVLTKKRCHTGSCICSVWDLPETQWINHYTSLPAIKLNKTSKKSDPSSSCGHGWRSSRRSCWTTFMPSLWRPSRIWSSASANSSRPRCRSPSTSSRRERTSSSSSGSANEIVFRVWTLKTKMFWCKSNAIQPILKIRSATSNR